MATPLSRPIRLLVSARDAAAAYNLAPVIKTAKTDERFSTLVLAQQPACDILQTAGLSFQKIEASVASLAISAEATALLRTAQNTLQQFRPNALLCGLSSPGDGGIDEALLAERSCPAFLMQDFWGEQNAFFGRGADAFFVLDEAAAQLSHRRHGKRGIVVGSPRHSTYESLNLVGLRQDVRQRLGFVEQRVIGLFGQSLHDAPGYLATITEWARAVACLPPPVSCIYRPHPRESSLDRIRSEALLRDHGLHICTPSNLSVEETIVACDAVCSAFSNCTYDAAFANRYSSEPLVTPVMLLFEPGIARLYESIVHIDEVPYRNSGIAMVIADRTRVGEALSAALTDDAKCKAWSAAQRNLPLPTHASRLVLDHIADAVEPITANRS